MHIKSYSIIWILNKVPWTGALSDWLEFVSDGALSDWAVRDWAVSDWLDFVSGVEIVCEFKTVLMFLLRNLLGDR